MAGLIFDKKRNDEIELVDNSMKQVATAIKRLEDMRDQLAQAASRITTVNGFSVNDENDIATIRGQFKTRIDNFAKTLI